MPVISTRYSTTTGSSYISPSTIGTYRSTADRASDRPNYTSVTESYLNRSRPTYRTSLSSSTSVGLSGYRDSTPTNYRHSTYISSSNGNDSILGSSRYTGDTQKHTASSPVVASKTKSINTLIDSLNQKLQSLERTVEQKKQANRAVKANVEAKNTRNRTTSSSTNGYSNGNNIMPSTTATNGTGTLTQGTTGSLKTTRLQIGSGTPIASTKFQNGGSSIPNGNLKRVTNGSSVGRDENFLRNEYELARNQVIGNGNSSGNSNSITITNKTNNIAKHNNLVNGNSNNNVNVNGRNIINVNHVDDELDKVRSKILSKVNANMMINGEHVNGDEDIKFIDSDDDKKLSPPPPMTPANATTKTPQQTNTSASANITIFSNKTIKTTSPSLSSSTSPSSPAISCSNRNGTSSNSSPSPSTAGTTATTTTVTIGGTKMKVITHDDCDTDEIKDNCTNVSASATIILPKKVTTKSVVITNGDAKDREASPGRNTTTGSELSSIFLEKKNLSNKLNDSNDSIRNASSLRSALPPTTGSSLTSRSWDRDSGLGSTTYSRYSSRNSNNYDSDSSTSSYIVPRSSAISSSSRSGSPGKDYSSNSYDRKAEKETTEGLCGLWNIGNTCFMNSVLQCLSNTSELTKAIKTLVSVRSSGKDQRIFTEFQDLIKQMWRPGNRSVNPSDFKQAFSSKNRMFSGSAQQDSQEFLRFFIDSVHSALNTATKAEPITIDDSMSDTKKADLMWNWYSKTENSVIKDLFAGQLKSTLKCTVCESTSVNFDPFWDLSLPLPSNTRCKLSDCLDLFIKEEVLDGDEMPTCSKCKTRRKCTKSFTIQRFPKILVIHLKRFSETRWSKLTTLVDFPTGENGLNLGPYASSSCSDSKNASYSLYATSNHMGSTAGGHYVAFCKHPINRRWYEYNDNSVTDASESSLVSSSAYLLFYERA